MTRLNIDVEDWPRCYVCDMPVEDFSGTDDGTALTFVATCHGETESVTIQDTMWDDFDPEDFEMEEAFRPKTEQGEQNGKALDGLCS